MSGALQYFEPDDPDLDEVTDEQREEVLIARTHHLNEVMTRALSGQLARGRPLKYWENLRFNPKHLQIILMKAAGYTNNYISRTFAMTPSRISVIVNHPDAMTLLSLLISHAADDLLDVKTRINAHAGEALDTVVDVMRNSRSEKVRASVGFDLLKMAGYGATVKVESVHTLKIEGGAGDRLAQALSESHELEGVDMTEYIEVVVGRGGAEGSLLDESGKGEPSGGSTPTTSDEPPIAGAIKQLPPAEGVA